MRKEGRILRSKRIEALEDLSSLVWGWSSGVSKGPFPVCESR